MRKSDTIYNWKRRGLICDNIDEIYDRYTNATNCELCNRQFAIRRYMDHNHQTGAFRNIVCNSCNMSDTDIIKKTKSGHQYISIFRNGFHFQKTILGIRYHKYFKTLQEAVDYKTEFFLNL